MADKFPALDSENLETEDLGSSDFLSRESELVGDEFKTEQDQEILAESDDDINDFKEQFPEVEEAGPSGQNQHAHESEEDEQFEGFGNSTTQFDGESKHLSEWKERRDLEISKREEANSKKKKDVVQKAQQTIDDFYDNYNNKKEQHSKEVLKEQEQYLEKRDGFLKRGTLWDRVNELVTEVGDLPENEDRDKSRFTELLKKLKGKEKAPGAGGY
ncbi:uncharacterized protein CANTADRAFT_90135 [Suhomyces tanzawaensis NRRL Y-17324]|uniref:Clathrin light chain n=1 Tax=Suhomyces tanzawaensis NRRL Y-17324 TaxID=984487 RepID=A0A1E4SHK0_9ASCO|nr:uncharacterized protein CANTADRAFT_90135 [Suhomyces tanzawaensis NRRL Y-17324]ODV78981.1 hypothetical protein CANTADRAFT_90135 [Suhomyces tanzawaensis NRRL Y-17324]